MKGIYYKEGERETNLAGYSVATAKKISVYLDIELKELVPMFLNAVEHHTHTMLNALQKEDFATISRIGHTLKGDGGSYGFDPITTIGDELEQAAKRNDTIAIEIALEQLSQYLLQIDIIYLES